MSAIASLYAVVGADTRGFQRGMNEVGKSMSGAAVAFGSFKGVAMAALGAVAAAVGGISTTIAIGVRKAASFEQAMADIASVMGESVNAIGPLARLVEELGKSSQLKVTMEEAASAVEALVKNGLTMQEVLDGAAKAVVLLANASGGSFELAADVATGAMQMFGKNAGDLKGVMDTIAGVLVKSKFGLEDFAHALAMGGGAAGAFGVSMEDFSTVMAATASKFASGSDAGTSFKVFLQRLVPQSEEAAEAMRKLGLYTGLTAGEIKDIDRDIGDLRNRMLRLDPSVAGAKEEFAALQVMITKLEKTKVLGQSAFFDANGNMRSMAEISERLKASFEGLTDAQKIEAATTIFGSDAMRTAISLAGISAKEFETLKRSIMGMNAEEMASTRMQTLAGMWETFTGNVSAGLVRIGQEFTPAARSIVQWLMDMQEKYMPAIVDWFGRLGDWLSSGKVLGGLERWIKGVQTLADTLLGWAEGGNFWGEVWDWMVRTVQTAFQNIIDWVGAKLSPWVEQMRAWGAAAVEWLSWQHLSEMAIEWWGALKKWADKTLPLWIATLSLWGRAAGDWITDTAIPWLAEKLPLWWEKLSAFLDAYWPLVEAKLRTWGTALGDWVTVSAIPWMERTLPLWWNTLSAFLDETWPLVAAKLREWGTALGDWVTVSAMPALERTLPLWWAQLVGWFEEHLPPFVELMRSWGNNVGEWVFGPEQWATMKAKAGEWWDKFSGWWDEHLPNARDTVSRWGDGIRDWLMGPDKWEKLKMAAGAWWENLKAWFADRWPQFRDVLVGWGDSIGTWIFGEERWNNFRAQALEWWGRFTQWIDDGAPDLASHLTNWAIEFVAWTFDLKTKILKGLQPALDGVIAWLEKDGRRQIEDALVLWTDAFYNWVEDIDASKLRESIGDFLRELKRVADKMDTIVKEIGAAIAISLFRGMWAGAARLGNYFSAWWNSVMPDWLQLGTLPGPPSSADMEKWLGVGANAGGTDNWRGGWTWVGEQGPELVNLPGGSRVLSHGDSMAAGSTININGDIVLQGTGDNPTDLRRAVRFASLLYA